MKAPSSSPLADKRQVNWDSSTSRTLAGLNGTGLTSESPPQSSCPGPPKLSPSRQDRKWLVSLASYHASHVASSQSSRVFSWELMTYRKTCLGACTVTRSAEEMNKWGDIQNSQAVPLDNRWLFKSSTVCFQYWLPCDVERPSLSRGVPTRSQYD